LANDTQDLHFFNREVGQLHRTAPLNFKYEFFRFGFRVEKPPAPFPVLG
jgi:hypothetical protein